MLHALPDNRYASCQRFDVRVDSGSLIHVDRNAYSVNSRLIREKVEVRLHMEHLEVWYAQRLVERLEELVSRYGKRRLIRAGRQTSALCSLRLVEGDMTVDRLIRLFDQHGKGVEQEILLALANVAPDGETSQSGASQSAGAVQ